MSLEVVNEAATIVESESKLFPSEIVQKAVAKFYTAVFLLLGDVAIWYTSKSREIFFNSLHEGFHKQFASELQNVQRMSAVVGRTAKLTAVAESRYARLSIEDLRQELLDERAGLSGALRRIAQSMSEQFQVHVLRLEEHSRLQHEETRRMPQDSANENNFIQSQSNSPQKTATLNQLQAQMERLLVYVTKGSRILNEPEDVLPITPHERVTLGVGSWLESPKTSLLYLEYPPLAHLISEIPLVAYRIVLSADSLKAPVLSFFCRQNVEQSQE